MRGRLVSRQIVRVVPCRDHFCGHFSQITTGQVAPTMSLLQYGQGTFCFTSRGIDGMVWSSWRATLPCRPRWKKP